jgi:hypothetical protein
VTGDKHANGGMYRTGEAGGKYWRMDYSHIDEGDTGPRCLPGWCRLPRRISTPGQRRRANRGY